MPDLIRHPEASIVIFPGFRLVGRNDKSLRDNQKLTSPEGEGFPPSPIGTLNIGRQLVVSDTVIDRQSEFGFCPMIELFSTTMAMPGYPRVLDDRVQTTGVIGTENIPSSLIRGGIWFEFRHLIPPLCVSLRRGPVWLDPSVNTTSMLS